MKFKKSSFVLAFAILSLAGCINKSNQSTFKCGRLLSDEELVELNKTAYKDYQPEDLDKLATLTTLVNEINEESAPHEVFFREKSATSLTLEIFGVEAPLQIEKTACAIFGNKELKLPRNVNVVFHKYLNGGAESEFLIGVANK